MLPSNGMGFNPLNQVYVFNQKLYKKCSFMMDGRRFNPLNQVYVFNDKEKRENELLEIF